MYVILPETLMTVSSIATIPEPPVPSAHCLMGNRLEERGDLARSSEREAEVVQGDGQSLCLVALPLAFEYVPTFKYFEQCFQNSPSLLVCVQQPRWDWALKTSALALHPSIH